MTHEFISQISRWKKSGADKSVCMTVIASQSPRASYNAKSMDYVTCEKLNWHIPFKGCIIEKNE